MPDGNDSGRISRRGFLKATGIAGVSAAFGGVASATPGREPGPKEGELVVGTAPSTSVSTAEAQVQRTIPDDASVVHRNETLGYLAVRVPDEASAQANSGVARAMERKPGVEYVEKNATYHAFADDPRLSSQYAPQQVNAPAAWDTTLGSEQVTVAVVDQGVQYTHPDLEAQFGADKGHDFVDNDSDPSPDSASELHGTHVSGIASATTDNGTGVAGMSNSRLLSGRALGGRGGGSLSDIADAIQWAADQGADIINLSLGGGGYSRTLKNAVSYAVTNGALPICAAGNSGERGVAYPAAYSECVAVGALTRNENLARFSQYGPDLDVVAPGVDVLSTVPYDSYQRLSGTSMACPATAGVAALGLAVDPSMGPSGLRQRLKQTAVDVGLSEEEQGSGRVDAANIVGDGGGGGGGNQSPTAAVDASPTAPSTGETVTFDGSGSSDPDGSITSYEWAFGDGASATGQTVTHSYSSTGEYTATLTVTDGDGASASASVAITVGDDGGGGGGGDCDAPQYDPYTLYEAGDRASYEGAVWEAQIATRANAPGPNDPYWSTVGECSV